MESHDLDQERLRTYRCGHAFSTPVPTGPESSTLTFTSVDGSKLARDYQKQGIEFILASDFNCVIGDQMRLGKTPQALLALANARETRLPCLILVRAANTWQWVRETKTWFSDTMMSVFPISGTKGLILPGFDTYVCSMDTFSRKGMMERLREFGFKLVIVDEAHSFKNQDSKRSQALIAFLKDINRAELVHEIPFVCMMCKHQWTETVTVKTEMGDNTRRVSKTSFCPECHSQQSQSAAAHIKTQRTCGCVMLTGTPIKNRADEYFVPLNIVDPAQFPSMERFRRQYLMQDGTGKWSRISPYAMASFQAAIKPYVLRREKEDVYTDLPPINRMYTIIEMEDEVLRKAYNKILDKMEREVERSGSWKFFDNIGDLMILRQICGISKVKWTADYVEASLLDNTNKMAIGIHHHSVRDALANNLAHIGVLRLSGEDSPETKDSIMRTFETSPERTLVINMLAGGVGMDFHYVNDVLILERQWSSADEEQFEFRFYNPDRSIKNVPTNIEYIIAKGTIDEWFYDMVEEKRQIFGETLASEWSLTNDSSSFRDLMGKTLSHRL